MTDQREDGPHVGRLLFYAPRQEFYRVTGTLEIEEGDMAYLADFAGASNPEIARSGNYLSAITPYFYRTSRRSGYVAPFSELGGPKSIYPWRWATPEEEEAKMLPDAAAHDTRTLTFTFRKSPSSETSLEILDHLGRVVFAAPIPVSWADHEAVLRLTGNLLRAEVETILRGFRELDET